MRHLITIKKHVGVLSIVFIFIGLTYAAGSSFQEKVVPSNGSTIITNNIEIYWDAQGINEVNNIDWGNSKPNFNITKLLYVKNISTNNVTLTMSSSNYYPVNIENYLTLNWNYSKSVLKPDDIKCHAVQSRFLNLTGKLTIVPCFIANSMSFAHRFIKSFNSKLDTS